MGIKEVPCIVRHYNNEKDKIDDAVRYQMARRNLKTYQTYGLIYNYWKEFGFEHGETLKKGSEKQELSLGKLTFDEIGTIFGVAELTVRRAVIIRKS